jgi:hypothetical protein
MEIRGATASFSGTADSIFSQGTFGITGSSTAANGKGLGPGDVIQFSGNDNGEKVNGTITLGMTRSTGTGTDYGYESEWEFKTDTAKSASGSGTVDWTDTMSLAFAGSGVLQSPNIAGTGADQETIEYAGTGAWKLLGYTWSEETRMYMFWNLGSAGTELTDY